MNPKYHPPKKPTQFNSEIFLCKVNKISFYLIPPRKIHATWIQLPSSKKGHKITFSPKPPPKKANPKRIFIIIDDFLACHFCQFLPLFSFFFFLFVSFNFYLAMLTFHVFSCIFFCISACAYIIYVSYFATLCHTL